MLSTSSTVLTASSTPTSPYKHHRLRSQFSFPVAQLTKRNESNFIHTLSYNPKFREAVVSKAQITPEENHEEILFQKSLPKDLQPELMPKHVAVIMDGNRRWALQRGLPVGQGYGAGGKKLRELVKHCCEWGVKVLTVFAFSTENWTRPKDEVDFLMRLFEEVTESLFEEGKRDGVRLSIIGDTSKLPKSLQKLITFAEETLKANRGLHLMIALNYGGKQDIIHATKNICSQVKDGLVQLEDINERLFEEELHTKCSEFPNPDILIRTSGEIRISNFMLWQLAYTELFFVEKLFPDVEAADFIEVLRSYQGRHRRYGGCKY